MRRGSWTWTGILSLIALALGAGVSGPAFSCADPTFLWEKSYNAPANGVDEANGVVIDSSGNIFVVGSETRTDLAEASNWLVRKYDAAGTLLWSSTYNYAGASVDVAEEVALDSSGNIVVAGFANWVSNASGSFVTRKYDTNGHLLWSRTYNPLGVNDDHMAIAVDVDPSGNAYVVGYEDRADLGQGPNWRILKYSSAGALVWATSYNGSSQDQAIDVRTDPSGNVIVGGWVNGGTGGWLLRKYDSAGSLVWSKAGSSVTGTPDACYGLETTSAGGIYAVGRESVGGEGMNWLVQKWDAGGNLLWSRSHNGPANNNDIAKAVRIIADGSIVVVGYEMFNGSNENWLMKSYDSNGALLWSRTIAPVTPEYDEAMDVSSGSDGSFVVVGYDNVAGQNHNWRIQKYSCPLPSNSGSSITPPPAPTEAKGMYVYPHPLKCPGGNAVFEMEKAGTATLRIVNMRGQVVKTVTRDVAASPRAEVFLDCTLVKNGAYLIQGELKYADGTTVRLKPYKFVVAGDR